MTNVVDSGQSTQHSKLQPKVLLKNFKQLGLLLMMLLLLLLLWLFEFLI